MDFECDYLITYKYTDINGIPVTSYDWCVDEEEINDVICTMTSAAKDFMVIDKIKILESEKIY